MTLPRAMASNFRFTAMAAATVALTAAFATPAAAQSLRVELQRIGDREKGVGTLELSQADCDDDAEVLFRLSALGGKERVDIYKGSNCASTERDEPDMTTCDWIKTVEPSEETMVDITMTATELGCEEGSGDPKLWFLPVDQSRTGEDVGDAYATIDFSIDTSGPDAPTDLEGGAGENQIPVSWKTDDDDIDGFVVYIDSSPIDGDAGTGCGSDVLIPGEPAPSGAGGYTTKPVNRASAQGVDLDKDDIDGDRAAVAVVAIDIAGNKSVLSDLTCVEVVPTTSPWDLYEMRSDAVEPGCPCAAMGTVHAETAWPVALALTLLGMRRRRRKQRGQEVER